MQERIPPFGDVALGVVTTQRTEGDNDKVYPARVSKTGLRWYKNRVVTNYDHDPINPDNIFPEDSKDGWRTTITMTFITSGRMEIGKYFEDMTSEELYDLSRAIPLLTALKSPRPIDAFEGKDYPQVYDYAIDSSWHILTFYNYNIHNQEWSEYYRDYSWNAYDSGQVAFAPDSMLHDTIKVNFGDKTDDGGLGLNRDSKYYVFDFWNWSFIGEIYGNQDFEQKLRPGETRVMALHEVEEHPQFISTNRHLLQGLLDMEGKPAWDAQTKSLAGVSKTIEDEPYKIIFASNGRTIKKCTTDNATWELEEFDRDLNLFQLTIRSEKNTKVRWSIEFM